MNNTTGSVWQPVAVTATGLTTVTGNVFVAKTPEVFSYDLDGNMTSDGRWNYTWDAENRLIKVESRPDTPSSSWRRIEWTYDAFGRRIQQVTSIWTNNSWFVVENLKFVSDPMLFGRHIVELNATNNALVRSYVWGLDLSGTMDGAGGVGGLIVTVIHTGTKAGTYFPMYDGNGNVMGCIRAGDGALVTQYEYGPFGELISASGPLARSLNFLFSTKYHEWETDLYYYGYRYYNSNTGRWLNRDPIAEAGGFHLYAFCANNSLSYIDAYGRDITDWTWLEPAANFAAGVGDSLTMGIMSWLRGKMDIDQVDYSSGLYYVGEATEFVVETTVTLGSGALVRRSAQFSGKAGRYLLEANARQGFRKAIGGASGAVRDGIVHHWNPIRQGRFPLPYRWAAQSHVNMTWIQDGRFLTAGQKHRFQHWYLKMLDAADVARAWSSPIRSGGNAIIQYVNALGVQQNSMGNCPPGPNLTIEVILSVTFDGYNEAYTDIPESPELLPFN